MPVRVPVRARSGPRVTALRRQLGALALLLAAPAVHAGICLSEQMPHPCDTLRGCDAALRVDALDAAARLKLCDLHVDEGQLVEAAIAVRRGVQLCTGQRRVCGLLERALSNVEEQRLAQERDRGAEATQLRRDVTRGYCLGNITTDRTIAACEEIVADKPSAALYAALVGKLLQSGQPARALGTLRDAARAEASSAELDDLESRAVALRAESVRACEDEGRLEACDAALLAGLPDEAAVLRARAQILAASGSAREAFRALEDAFRLSADRSTAKQIAELDAGKFERSDAEFLRLRARAFRVLGDAASESSTLQRLVAMDAAGADLRARLASLQPGSGAGSGSGSGAEPDPASVASAPPAQGAETRTASRAERVSGSPGPTPAIAERDADASRVAFSNRILADGRTH